MKHDAKKRLKAAGWTVGTPSKFLGLTKEEIEFVEIKLALAQSVRARRNARHWTQSQLAKMVGSSQSRIAKLEAADPSVTLDMVVRSLFATGASRREVAGIIDRRHQRATTRRATG